MRKQESFLYDVFISYSSADQSWVTQWLLPHLERAGLRVAIDFRDFVVGAPRLEEVQRFVTQSHFVITVLTPAWQESEWNEFATLLGRTLDPAARRRKLLPLVLQPTSLPPLLLAPRLEVADFTTEAKRPQELARLLRTIQQTIPPRVWPDGPELTPPLWWRWWLRYHHRQLRLGGALVVVLLLTLMMAARIAPFQDRLVWLADSAEFPNAVALHSTGTTLIVGAENV
ncbi:MAG: toll/interleukin-1 receptor domain-containing protein, partial [Caldilineaceae bacterium]|nr:toll/interleukin-1 receptor domain-containing protein [Caldilineaceae bacterium]